MKTILVVFLIVSASILGVRAEEEGSFYDDVENVEELTDKTFDDFVANNDGFVEFYAPWCGHCKHLKPVFIEAASKAPEGVKFAALDANKGEHGELAQKYKIQGFPTIKYFRKGNAVDYDGDRSVDGFLEFAETMSKPSVTVIKSAEDLTAFDGRKGVRVYGYFADEESDAAKAFKAVADVRFQKQAYGLVNSAEQFGDNKEGQVVIVKAGEDNAVYTADEGDLAEWIAGNSFPVLDELNQQSFQDRVSESTVGNFIVFINQNEDNSAVLDTVRDVASQYKGRTQFFHIDGVEYGQFAKNLGIDTDNLPALAVLTPSTQNHYVYEAETINKDDLTKFVEDQLADKLVRKYKSADAPAEQTGPTRVIVGSTFEDEVINSDKDVFVMFYAPWCGHCKRLKPHYAKVAKFLAPIESLVVAKIDMDANEIDPKYGQIQGFPTLKLYKAGDKENPVDYSGNRTFKAIVKWLKKNAATEFELPKVEKKDGEQDAGEDKDEL